MQNEFEKQVQQKMEELKLIPSDPVWEKVEMQIRKKKDRRRVIFWIPLFALVGAGLWLGIDQYSNRISYNKKDEKTSRQNSVDKSVSDKNTFDRDHRTILDNKEINNQTNSELKEEKHTDIGLPIFQKRHSKKIEKGWVASLSKKQKLPSEVEDNLTSKNGIINDNPQQPKQNVIVQDSSLKNIHSIDTTISTKEKIDTKTFTEEPTKKDSTSIKKTESKKYASSKWKYTLVAFAGTSGLGHINVYNGQKSMNVYNSPPAGASSGGGQFTNYGPSEVENGFSFTVGAGLKKQLGRRIVFSTGLQYNYYSNTLQVGTVVNQNRVIMDFSVTQYYSNSSAILQPYKNQYHFISVPADFDLQLLKKHPLDFNFGLSFQYLAQTNALRFDYSTQSYFHNIDAFNRAQLFSGFGLTYSLPLKQKPLTFGPQFQYGLTQLEKGNSDHHIFSYGLKALWQFKK